MTINSTEIRIPNLEFKKYSIDARAMSTFSKIKGPWSSASEFTVHDQNPIEKFKGVNAFPSLTEITLHWNWTGDPNTLTDFQILISFQSLTREGPAAATITKGVNERLAKIDSLEKDTSYVINLSAVGKNGQRAEWPPLPVKTLAHLNATVRVRTLKTNTGKFKSMVSFQKLFLRWGFSSLQINVCV